MSGVLDAISRIAAERMVNSVVAGVLLTFLIWALLRLLPRVNAGTRVAVWFSVLVAVPGLSFSSLLSANSSGVSRMLVLPVVLPESWAYAAMIVWTIVAGFFLLRVGIGLWRIRRTRQACSPIELAALEPAAREAIQRLHPKRVVSLLQSDSVRVPMAVGFIKPAIILPKWTLTELPSAELSAVILHECAHLRRWDDWTNFLQKVLRALFFFHPALWWLDRQLGLEREIACDDMVIAATSNAPAYARCLVDVAEKSLLWRSLALAQAAVHRFQHISLRVSRIMDSTRSRSTRVSKLSLTAVAAVAAACLVGVLHSPTLIAFQETPPQLQSALSAANVIPAVAHESASPRVVAAKWKESSESRSRDLPKKAALTKARRPAVLKATLENRHREVPSLIQAGLRDEGQIIPARSMVVVMRNTTVDSDGRITWSMSVWQLTVFHPAPSTPTVKTVSKQI